MEFQIEARIVRFQQENTMKGQFITVQIFPFPVICGRQALNTPPMPIDYIDQPNKIDHYTSDSLLASVSVTYGNTVSNLTTPSDSPQVIVLNYDDTNTNLTIMSDIT